MARKDLGSAQFSTHEGHDKDLVFNGFNIGIGLSTEGKKGYFGALTSRHFLSVAPTRSGKGAALIINNLLYYRGSVMVIDPKGENAYITAKRRRELGQKTIILDPWGEVNRRYGAFSGEFEEVASFNPLSILDPANENYSDDLAYIADSLIINQGKDPHWDDSARELVSGLISYAVEKYQDSATLPHVRLMLSKPMKDIAGIAQDAQTFGAESIAARKLGRFVGEGKELSSIISTALTQTAFLDSAALGKNLETSSFSFDELITAPNGVSIFLVLPVDKLQTYGRWLRIMISIGIRTVARNTIKLPAPVLFILDEFGTIGKLSAVAQAYGLMAGLQMCLWAFVQDLTQLKRDYPDEWQTFIGNSEMITFFDVMDYFTCEHVSKMLGSKTVEVISEATATIRKGGFLVSEKPDYSAMSDQMYSRPLLDPSEVRRYSSVYGIFIDRHITALFDKDFYFDDVFFSAVARQDPHHKKLPEAEVEEVRDPTPEEIATAIFNKYGYVVHKGGFLSPHWRVEGTKYKSYNEFVEAAKNFEKQMQEKEQAESQET